MPSDYAEIIRFTPREHCGLRQAIQSVLADHTQAIVTKKLQVEFEVERNARFAECRHGLTATLERLISLAIERSPVGSVLLITVLATRRGLEIEVADDGPQLKLQARPLIGFGSRELASFPAAGRVQVESEEASFGLFYAHCPQGGLAWTVVVPGQEAREHLRAA